MEQPYAIEMLNITKRFPGIVANDNITLQLKRGEIHALLGENGAGKSTLMSVLFGLYQPEEGVIKKDGQVVQIKDPNDANALGIGMVHQHFKLVECFSILDYIILGVEPCKNGFLQKQEAREQVSDLLKRSFRPEFLNRLDEIVIYKPLTKDNVTHIIDLMAADQPRRLEDKQLTVVLPPAAKEEIIASAYDPIYGARPLRRYLQHTVETLVGRKVIADEVAPGSTLTVDCVAGALVVH